MADRARTVGDALVEFLDLEMPNERAKKTSLETRATAIITTSGALVTLLLALAALVSKSKDFTPPTTILTLLAIAASTFVGAAIGAILCTIPGAYNEVDPTTLGDMTDEAVWDSAGEDARLAITRARLDVLQDWREVNERKARVLLLAGLAELLAVAVTAAAVVMILAF